MKTNKAYQRPKTPDKILILKVMAPTSDGDIFARPVFWDEFGDEPIVYIEPDKFTGNLSYGDRILTRVKLVNTNNFDYVGEVIGVKRAAINFKKDGTKQTSEDTGRGTMA